ncbi:hypothetical protein AVEN_211140-1 [Araneus ventricosus]|uniref:Uncharacterized protein n=1 Tax=Araneus ventricosus TaxID=182803 RepID=A0A4Y2G1C8_ARAVE|nr:hypothetical protein AVEN_211140-1 [Araneus ventricosus]
MEVFASELAVDFPYVVSLVAAARGEGVAVVASEPAATVLFTAPSVGVDPSTLDGVTESTTSMITQVQSRSERATARSSDTISEVRLWGAVSNHFVCCELYENTTYRNIINSRHCNVVKKINNIDSQIFE